uniref:RING-type domain-containing protein n=1 Tax=Percolomonas cosmopolitus TaxID=63605 RepID=A0A7S1PGB3_9EUKA|mmetsp:Transcript_2748/g.10588  ORF Transcript_2748/g.10588 Transcript_2748/m.10588 type:complete len:981 (+) Transcript_2748:161-3103(+)
MNNSTPSSSEATSTPTQHHQDFDDDDDDDDINARDTLSSISAERSDAHHTPHADTDSEVSSNVDSSQSDTTSDDDEDDDEPLLKYSRLGGSLQQIFDKGNCASALAVAERFLALGTHLGYLYILDFEGNIVKAAEKKLALRPHTESINDICVDASAEYVASCSNDGRVVVTHLYGKESHKMEFAKPVKAVAIDPHYARKNDKPICSGGKASKVILTKKGWFKTKQTVLDENEGCIHAIKWHKNYISWANDQAIKVYDVATEQRISKISRKENAPRPDMFRCCIQWVSNDPVYGTDDDSVNEKLIIAWGQEVQVIIMKERSHPQTQQKSKYLEVMYMFKVDFFICGIAPHGNNLLVLAYGDENSDADEDDEENPQGHFRAPPPDLMILDQKTGKEISCDELTIKDYHKYFATDYRLEYNPMEASYYILSQKDIVMAKPRDADDHITFLVGCERYEEALQYANEHEKELKVHSVKNLGKSNLNYLMTKGEYTKAAELVQKIAKEDKKLWEHWIYEFFHRKQLKEIIPYIPSRKPQLDSKFYEMMLNEFLNHDIEQFYSCIKKWPRHLYKASVVIARVEQQLKDMERIVQGEEGTDADGLPVSQSSMRLSTDSLDILKNSLALLYQHDGQHDKALNIYFELGQSELFDYIKKYNLFHCVRDKVIQLLDFDENQAIQLLVAHTDQIPPSDVVEQLRDEENTVKSLKREHLMKYLHELNSKKVPQAQQFHLLLVKLYAENDTEQLHRFLNDSQSFDIDSAFQICEMFLNIHQDPEDRRNIYKSLVFLYRRMGNNQQALQLIINQLADVDFAIDYVKQQRDDSELWQDLINHSLKNGKFISGLLDHIGEYIGDHINPQTLIKEIPEEMEIDDLKYKLAKIISDYSLQKTLQERAQEILLADIKKLSLSLFQKQRRGLRVSHMSACVACKQPFHAQEQSLAFFCGHVYHSRCYQQVCGAEGGVDVSNVRCVVCDQQDNRQDRRRKRR